MIGNLPFTRSELDAAVQADDVTVRRHPTLPLSIYNYSKKTQYDSNWNEITETCRGLILDDDEQIVARPFRKFFNLGQVELPIGLNDPVKVMDKADGSLGILWSYDGQVGIATRGSFISEQAIKATQIWNNKYAAVHNQEVFGSGHTYLFEIIYSENRIVLDYSGVEDLILLGVVSPQGNYYGPEIAAFYLDWSGPVVEVMSYNSIAQAQAHMNRENAEGYVIQSGNFMVKLKQDDYLELHRLVTNATPKTVWEQLKAGKSREDIVSVFPDEFYDYINSMIDPFVTAFLERSEEITNNYNAIMNDFCSADYPGFRDRKGFAQAVVGHKDKRYFFLLLDSRSIADALWSELKPKGDTVQGLDNA